MTVTMPKPGAIKMYDDAVRGPRLPGRTDVNS